jgi:hypothetical protein
VTWLQKLIRRLENEKLELEETVEELRSHKTSEKQTKKDGKTYSVATRMMVYDAVVNQVPTQNIPPLIESCKADGRETKYCASSHNG